MAFMLSASTALGRLRLLGQSMEAIRESLAEGVQGSSYEIERSLRDLEELVDRLPHRWEEIKREASRLDGRARYAVGRVRKELEERGLADEGLADLDRELRIVNGEGGDESGLPPVQEPVGESPAVAQPDPLDWQAVARKRKFGI